MRPAPPSILRSAWVTSSCHEHATATRITSRHLERDGNLAYESGDADVTVLRDGVPVTNGGRYLTVWQAQPDGAWKIIRNIVLP